MDGEVDEDDVVDACREVDIVIGSATRVGPDVLRCVLDGGESRTVYIKLYPESKFESVETIARDAPRFGLPPSRIVPGDGFVGLLMEEAPGRPLSRVLPFALLPLLWSRWGGGMQDAYEAIGTYLGTLHSTTRSNRDRPLLPERVTERTVERLEENYPRLDNAEQSAMERALYRAPDIQVPHACTHGDPSAHNVFYEPGAVTLIDAVLTRKAAVQDHANALMGIRLMVDRVPMARETARSELQSAYWEGYRSSGIEATVHENHVRLLLIVKMLSQAEFYLEGPTSMLSKLVSRRDLVALRREIVRTARKLDPEAI